MSDDVNHNYFQILLQILEFQQEQSTVKARGCHIYCLNLGFQVSSKGYLASEIVCSRQGHLTLLVQVDKVRLGTFNWVGGGEGVYKHWI